MIIATAGPSVTLADDALIFVAAAVRAQRRARRNNGLAESPRESAIFDEVEQVAESARRVPDRQPHAETTTARPEAEWSTVADVAQRLGISERAVRYRCERGHLRARRGVRGWEIDARGLDGCGG